MSTAMVSIENAPRDLQGLMQLKRTILFRLAHSLNMFADETQEAAFNQAPTEQMAQALAAAIQQYDAAQGGAPAQAAPAAPQAPAPMPVAQPQAPAPAVPGAQIALPAMPPAAQQPVMPGIAMPPQTAPQMPAVAAQPPPAPMPAVVPPQMPAAPAPQPVAPPAPPAAPALPPPIAMPPAAAQQPVRAPATKAAPQAVVPPPSPPQPPPAPPETPPAAGGQLLQIQQQVALSLQQLSDTSQKTQQWLEEQQTGQAMLLSTILATQLYMAEQSGIGADMVTKGIKQMGPEAVAKFLQALSQEEGK